MTVVAVSASPDKFTFLPFYTGKRVNSPTNEVDDIAINAEVCVVFCLFNCVCLFRLKCESDDLILCVCSMR